MSKSFWEKMQQEKLPFPTVPIKAPHGIFEEYIIPAERKADVLKQLYLFGPVPGIDEVWEDLHNGKPFRIGDFRVVRENGQNHLVSPYYDESGSTVIDWYPPADQLVSDGDVNWDDLPDEPDLK